MMMRSLTTVILVLLGAHTAQAQNNTLGSWNLVNVKLNYTENWSVFAEAQLRSLKFYDHFHYYEYKGAA